MATKENRNPNTPMLPILLVPGLNNTAEVYRNQMGSLWAFGPVTVANHTTGGNLGEIAAAVLADAPPRFALAGFSMGGYIAFEILRQARDRVVALALLDTSARPDTPEATEKRRQAIALTLDGKFGQAVAATFPNAVHPLHVEDAQLRDLHRNMALAVGPEVYVRHQSAIIARADSRADLSGIGVPTLVLVGDADAITTPEAAREMAGGIPRAQLVVVPNAGHMALLEQPRAVTDAMRGWLEGVETQRI